MQFNTLKAQTILSYLIKCPQTVWIRPSKPTFVGRLLTPRITFIFDTINNNQMPIQSSRWYQTDFELIKWKTNLLQKVCAAILKHETIPNLSPMLWAVINHSSSCRGPANHGTQTPGTTNRVVLKLFLQIQIMHSFATNQFCHTSQCKGYYLLSCLYKRSIAWQD